MKRVLKWVAALLLLFLVLVAAAVLSFPYWFGTALGTAGKRYGVSFAKYERLKAGRFALNDVVRTNALFDLRISRVEGFLPYTWYSNLKGTNHPNAFLQVNGWRVVLHEPERKVSTKQLGVYAYWKEAERYIAQGRQWLPKATLLNGTLQYENRDYTFPVITWDQGKLDAGGVWPASFLPFEVKGKLTGELPYQLSFNMPSLDLTARVRVMETNALLNTRVSATYKESRADINADFAREGLLPLNATLKAPTIKIPGDLVKLDKYNELTGSLTGQWHTNTYELNLKAHADPIAGAQLPPADLQLVAKGDTNSVRIEQARSTTPGLEVSISDPIELTYQGKLLSERSELHIAADLEKLPWLKLKGQIAGTLLLKRGEKFPVATLRASGTKVEALNVQADGIEVAGVLNWPHVEQVQLTARLGTNSTLALEGSGDIATRTLEATSIRLDGTVPTNLIPANVQFERVKLNATVAGTLTNLMHEGHFELRNLITPHTPLMQLEGTWRAQQITFEQLALRARAGPAVLYLSGRGYEEGSRTNFVLRDFTLSKGDDLYLKLTNEATISLSANRQVELTPLHLVGTDKDLVLDGFLSWPREGKLDLDARNISPTLFQNFVTQSLRELDLRRLSLAAQWSNGPLFGKMSGSFSVAQEQFQRLGADVDVALDEGGLVLNQMILWDATGQIGTAQGFLPMSVNVASEPRLHFSKSDRIDFELKTSTNQAFWSAIEKLGHVRLTNAAVDLVVHGTTARPTGEFHARADALQFLELNRTNRELPAIGPLDAHIALNEQTLRIRQFDLRVLDQPAQITGTLPLGSNFWTQSGVTGMQRKQLLQYAFDKADLKIAASQVKLAPFTTYLPKYLSPQGTLMANVAVHPGRNLDGRIEFQDVETRPLPNVGVVQSIRAVVDLHQQQVEIKEFSGVLGGERLTVRGRADLSPKSVAKGYPDVDLAITGQDLPLARNPNIILRSDLDLHVRNGTNQIPVITGAATLRDSFLLRDIATLAPGRVARPSLRPPYFSIEQDPVDQWTLDVHVHGDKFMRVRSPFFQGLASANFRVTGTAQEPMALGEATLASGQIIFPFASLEVRQAIVSLTTEDPYLPHIFAVATGRAFGFDVRMEAEGPADKPNIQFTSVPALSSEQIILMLTTGAIPREDFSFSNQQRVGKLAMFLGQSFLAKLRPGRPTEEKLTIRSGQDVTEQGRQTYEVEYKLSQRWSLVGEYDRFGALNANVKWRLISR